MFMFRTQSFGSRDTDDQAEIIVAGGMESMTNIPYHSPPLLQHSFCVLIIASNRYYITKARFGGYKYRLSPCICMHSPLYLFEPNFCFRTSDNVCCTDTATASSCAVCSMTGCGTLTTTTTWGFAPKNAPQVSAKDDAS
jgi:hypothetical protein